MADDVIPLIQDLITKLREINSASVARYYKSVSDTSYYLYTYPCVTNLPHIIDIDFEQMLPLKLQLLIERRLLS